MTKTDVFSKQTAFAVFFPVIVALLPTGCARGLVEPEPTAGLPAGAPQPQPAVTLPLNAIPGPVAGLPADSPLERVPADSVMALPREERPARYYEVNPGDTLNAIAARFGTSSGALIQANGIKNPDAIQPGQLLYIPQSQ